MPRWASTVEVAGVSFSGCKALLLNGPKFATNFRGSSAIAADGTPHIQRVNAGVKGIKFGVSFAFARAADLNSMRAAIQAAEAAADPFRAHVVDAQYSVDVLSWPDYDSDEWLSHGPESEGIIENVVLRLISVGPFA